MERAPRARVRDQEKARANATPGTETAHPRIRIAEDEAVELAKGPDAVRVKAEKRDRDGVGNRKLAAAVGGYKMLQPQGGGSLATPDLFFSVEPARRSTVTGCFAHTRLFHRLSIDHER
jgi:hypothetical protein